MFAADGFLILTVTVLAAETKALYASNASLEIVEPKVLPGFTRTLSPTAAPVTVAVKSVAVTAANEVSVMLKVPVRNLA